jgi:NAD(P)-dependent dehydrogenase (short-subunit alcohol dehydrogenase family)
MVLGGTSGIGQDITSYFRARGEVDVASYGLEDFDVTDDGPALFVRIKNFSPTHVVYSVGVHQMDWLEDVTLSDFNVLMKSNVWGFIKTMQELQALGTPVSVVAITSDAAWRPMRTSLAYCASKAALEMAVKVASRELAPAGWRINAVAPGKVHDTAMTDYVNAAVPDLRGWTPKYAEEYERNSSVLGRPVLKSEVTKVVVDVLFGPPALTGIVVPVNGGR